MWKERVLRTQRCRFSEVHSLHFEHLGPIGPSSYEHQLNDAHGKKLSTLDRQLDILSKLIEKNF